MSDPELSKESRDTYSSVIEKAINMTESIKHAIVLLQVHNYPTWQFLTAKKEIKKYSKELFITVSPLDLAIGWSLQLWDSIETA